MGFNFNQFEIATSACRPFIIFDEREYCQKLTQYFLKKISLIKPDYLIIFVYWSHLSDEEGINKAQRVDEFLQKINFYKSLGAKKVIVIGPMPTYTEDIPNIIVRDYLLKGKKIPDRLNTKLNKSSILFDDEFLSRKFGKDIYYVSLQNFLCNHEGCLIRYKDTSLKEADKTLDDLIIFDYGHLTYGGSKFVVQNLLDSYIK